MARDSLGSRLSLSIWDFWGDLACVFQSLFNTELFPWKKLPA